MIILTHRLAFWRRSAAAIAQVAAMVATFALIVSAGGCTSRSLVEVNVQGDAPFQSVTLRLTAGGTSKDFTGASFTATMPFKAGLYLSDSVSGSVDVVANVLDGSGNCIGAGSQQASGIASGSAVGPITLTVVHTTACSSVGGGTGGNGGGGTSGGSGGMSGTGTGGSGSGSGGSGNGSGGTSGGSGGTSGTGGQSAGTNLITNGDFSNGSNGWGIPAMTGVVNQTVTNGQFCVTVQVGTATIGYPSGGAPPFQINGGTSYLFSYQASSTGNLTIEAKVGDTQPPAYDATGSDFMNEPITQSLQTFTHTFTRGSTDSTMGVAFNLSGGPGTFCVDNVSLTAN